MSSSQSLCMELNSISDKKQLSFKSISQYSVSFASFKAIFILFKKSDLDCPCSASLIRAPIAVPLLKSCLDKINSFLSETSHLYKSIHLKANLYDLGATIFFINSNTFKNNCKNKTNPELKVKSNPTIPLSTFNSQLKIT